MDAARRAFVSLVFATCHSRACEARNQSGESSRSRDVVFVSRRRRDLLRRVAITSCRGVAGESGGPERRAGPVVAVHLPAVDLPIRDASAPKSGARHDIHTFVDRHSCAHELTHALARICHRSASCSFARSVLPLAAENDISRRADDARRSRTREERHRAGATRLRRLKEREFGRSSEDDLPIIDNGNLELDDVG